MSSKMQRVNSGSNVKQHRSRSKGQSRPDDPGESNRITNGPNQYQLGAEIGRGGFAVVFQAFNVSTAEFVAVKRFPLNAIDKDSLTSIESEIELMQKLNHPNIVKYYDTIRTKSHLYIVLELMENGSLANVIKKFGSFSESLTAIYITQVLRGLKYLHEQGVLHRDIKGANILTSKDGLVKLADFGVAMKLSEAHADDQDVVGSPYWIAPEIIEMSAPTAACDIWSVGCIIVELLTGKPPYFDLAPMAALFRIVSDDYPPLPEGISQALRDFLLLCFQKEPVMRSSASKLLDHPWLYNSSTQSNLARTSKLLQSRSSEQSSRSADAEGVIASTISRYQRGLHPLPEEGDATDRRAGGAGASRHSRTRDETSVEREKHGGTNSNRDDSEAKTPKSGQRPPGGFFGSSSLTPRGYLVGASGTAQAMRHIVNTNDASPVPGLTPRGGSGSTPGTPASPTRVSRKSLGPDKQQQSSPPKQQPHQRQGAMPPSGMELHIDPTASLRSGSLDSQDDADRSNRSRGRSRQPSGAATPSAPGKGSRRSTAPMEILKTSSSASSPCGAHGLAERAQPPNVRVKPSPELSLTPEGGLPTSPGLDLPEPPNAPAGTGDIDITPTISSSSSGGGTNSTSSTDNGNSRASCTPSGGSGSKEARFSGSSSPNSGSKRPLIPSLKLDTFVKKDKIDSPVPIGNPQKGSPSLHKSVSKSKSASTDEGPPRRSGKVSAAAGGGAGGTPSSGGGGGFHPGMKAISEDFEDVDGANWDQDFFGDEFAVSPDSNDVFPSTSSKTVFQKLNEHSASRHPGASHTSGHHQGAVINLNSTSESFRNASGDAAHGHGYTHGRRSPDQKSNVQPVTPVTPAAAAAVVPKDLARSNSDLRSEHSAASSVGDYEDAVTLHTPDLLLETPESMSSMSVAPSLNTASVGSKDSLPPAPAAGGRAGPGAVNRAGTPKTLFPPNLKINSPHASLHNSSSSITSAHHPSIPTTPSLFLNPHHQQSFLLMKFQERPEEAENFDDFEDQEENLAVLSSPRHAFDQLGASSDAADDVIAADVEYDADGLLVRINHPHQQHEQQRGLGVAQARTGSNDTIGDDDFEDDSSGLEANSHFSSMIKSIQDKSSGAPRRQSFTKKNSTAISALRAASSMEGEESFDEFDIPHSDEIGGNGHLAMRLRQRMKQGTRTKETVDDELDEFINYQFDEKDFKQNEHKDEHFRRSREVVEIMMRIRSETRAREVQDMCAQLIHIFTEFPELKEHFVTYHGVMPIMDMFEARSSTLFRTALTSQNHDKALYVLRVVNKIIAGSTRAQEQLSLVGIIPTVMNLFERSYRPIVSQHSGQPSGGGLGFTQLSSSTSSDLTNDNSVAGQHHQHTQYQHTQYQHIQHQQTFTTVAAGQQSRLPPKPTYFASEEDVDPLTVEAAHFIHQISSTSSLTLQMLIGAGGLNVLTNMVTFGATLNCGGVGNGGGVGGGGNNIAALSGSNSAIMNMAVPTAGSNAAVSACSPPAAPAPAPAPAPANAAGSSNTTTSTTSTTSSTPSTAAAAAGVATARSLQVKGIASPACESTYDLAEVVTDQQLADDSLFGTSSSVDSASNIMEPSQPSPSLALQMQGLDDVRKRFQIFQMGIDCVAEVFAIQASRTRDFCRLFVKLGLLLPLASSFQNILSMYLAKMNVDSGASGSQPHSPTESFHRDSPGSTISSKQSHRRRPSATSMGTASDLVGSFNYHESDDCIERKYTHQIATLFFKFSRSDSIVAETMVKADQGVITVIIGALQAPELKGQQGDPLSLSGNLLSLANLSMHNKTHGAPHQAHSAAPMAQPASSFTSAASSSSRLVHPGGGGASSGGGKFSPRMAFRRVGKTLRPAYVEVIELLLKCVKNLSMEPSAMHDLEGAGTMETLLPLLGGPINDKCKSHILPALFNMCRINRRRQELAAELGIVPHLKSVITAGSPLRQFALPIVFDLAHTSQLTRAELWKNDCVPFYLDMLKENYWQTFALNSLATWLSFDPENVGGLLVDPAYLSKLIDFFRSASTQTIHGLHKPLLDMMYKCPELAAALSVSTIFLASLVKRLRGTAEAIVLRSLLCMLQLLHRHHPHPSKWVVEHRLVELVEDFAQSEGQVLVCQLANKLLRDFESSLTNSDFSPMTPRM